MIRKTAAEAGADERTPSVPQYFSWISSTNEGSTEKQTIINLEFFKWLKDTYGMEIKIYAWDAGNFDGASNGYGDESSEKFRRQYPNGYAPVVAKAAEAGIRMGLWGSPDGFGDTPEQEKKRYDFFVKLCRDYHFAQFKLDGVCGVLRPEKADVYARMMQECRKYSPDLIVLNHRLKLYSAEKYVTTFLWNGAETYIDVFGINDYTCMHNRGYMFYRGRVENMERLTEDHGVCISSSIDYFEDDMIYQAFNRSLILAPEIYGNPWFMRDDEYPKLARVFNLHKRHAAILVDGMPLPDLYGMNAVARGSETHRFIATGNAKWEKQQIEIKLNEEIGLESCGRVAIVQRHPSERLIGIYDYSDTVKTELMPFRAHLFEIAAAGEADSVLVGCDYEVIKERNGRPTEVKMLRWNGGNVKILEYGRESVFGNFGKTDILEKAPLKLGTLWRDESALSDGEKLYETACFAADNDSLEARSLRRSGATEYPAVQAARDAFFAQKTYIYRGCEGRFAFDGNADTFFDGVSRSYQSVGIRVDGGCLRVDFGSIYNADAVEIVCFSIDKPIFEVPAQLFTETGEFSEDLGDWKTSGKAEISTVDGAFEAPVVMASVHNIEKHKGKLERVTYRIGGGIRYFRLAVPMDRIYSVKLVRDGREVALENPRINNLQAHYSKRKVVAVNSGEFVLPEINKGNYLAVAIEGEHGYDGAYCVAEISGKLTGFPSRAVAFLSNMWEHRVDYRDRNYTYYLPLDPSMSGQRIKVYTTFSFADKKDAVCDVYLCSGH